MGQSAIYTRIPGDLSLEEARALSERVAKDAEENGTAYVRHVVGRAGVMPLAVMIAPESIKAAAAQQEREQHWFAFSPAGSAVPPHPELGSGIFITSPALVSLALAGVVGAPPAIYFPPNWAWLSSTLVEGVTDVMCALPRGAFLRSLASHPPAYLTNDATLALFDAITAFYVGAATDGDGVLIHWEHR